MEQRFVYVLIFEIDYEGLMCAQVYSSPELAEDALKDGYHEDSMIKRRIKKVELDSGDAII